MTVTEAKNAFRNPKTKSTRTMLYGQIAWLFLTKSEWLPSIANALYLPTDFFGDADIAGHVCLGLSWFIREIQEAYRWFVALSIQTVKGWMHK